MKTGEKLKLELGLKGFPHVKISRAVISSYKILFVYYDSYRKQMPVTQYRIRQFPWVATIFSGTMLSHGVDKAPVFTPPINIEDYNGAIKGTLVVPVNLAGDRFIDKRQFSKIFESVEKEHPNVPLYHGSLKEFISISDLNSPDIISSTTQRFRKRRNQLAGAENTLAKLVDAYISEGDGSVTFAFLTTVTPYPEKEDPSYMEVDPETFNLTQNRSKTYEIQIKVLDFLDWLDVFSEQKVTESDMKEILDTADIQVFSTSPSFHYQGFNYWLSQLDGSIYPTTIKPQRWDKIHGDGDAFVDKHLYGLMRQIKFFRNQMASMITKKLKDRGLI